MVEFVQKLNKILLIKKKRRRKCLTAKDIGYAKSICMQIIGLLLYTLMATLKLLSTV